MQNLNEFEGITVDDDGCLVVRVKPSKNPEASASGKSKVLYSTHGNINLPDGSAVGVNWYRKTR